VVVVHENANGKKEISMDVNPALCSWFHSDTQFFITKLSQANKQNDETSSIISEQETCLQIWKKIIKQRFVTTRLAKQHITTSALHCLFVLEDSSYSLFVSATTSLFTFEKAVKDGVLQCVWPKGWRGCQVLVSSTQPYKKIASAVHNHL
jgi:hypothetical protein